MTPLSCISLLYLYLAIISLSPLLIFIWFTLSINFSLFIFATLACSYSSFTFLLVTSCCLIYSTSNSLFSLYLALVRGVIWLSWYRSTVVKFKSGSSSKVLFRYGLFRMDLISGKKRLAEILSAFSQSGSCVAFFITYIFRHSLLLRDLDK